jgi:hypothetical protein
MKKYKQILGRCKDCCLDSECSKGQDLTGFLAMQGIFCMEGYKLIIEDDGFTPEGYKTIEKKGKK